MSGKGHKQRPTDKAKFDSNYDAIFGVKNTMDKHQQIYDYDELRASWRATEELPFEWGGKTYQQMKNLLTGEYNYYNVTDEIYEPHVEFN